MEVRKHCQRRGRTKALIMLPLVGLVGAGLLMAGCSRRWHKPAENAEEMREKMNKAHHLFDEVDANESQHASLDRILDGLAPDAFGYSKEGRALKLELAALLEAETVDAQAVRDVQQRGLELAKRGSDRYVVSILELADVLDARQRRELVTHWRERSCH